MPSKEKRYRGDQFLLEWNSELSNIPFFVIEKITSQEAEINYLIANITSHQTSCILRTSTGLDFYGEKDFIVEGISPKIVFIRGKDKGFQKELSDFKSKYPNAKIAVDKFKQDDSRAPIVRDEDNGFIFTKIRTDPNFDPTKSTRFGRGYRRVEKIIKFGKHIGYYFIPFSEYLPQWASDIFGYDSFEEALEDIYPYQIKEIKAIKDLYATRPKNAFYSSMVLTNWQEYLEEILNEPINYDSQERHFYWFADFVGKVGKSMLVKHILSTRNDTLVISSTGKMSDLVCSIKEDITSSTRIKNIVLDIPREQIDDKHTDISFHLFDDSKHDGDTLKFMEACVNGNFTSIKYESQNFHIDYCLKVIVLSNSLPLITASSLDRWRINIIKDQNDLFIKDWKYNDDLPRITSRLDTIKFYLSNPKFIEYLKSHGFKTDRSPRPDEFKHQIP